MAKLVLVPNKLGSRSVKALAKALSAKLGFRVFRVNHTRIRNRIPFYIRSGTDKLTQFRVFKEANVPTPDFTTDRAVAASWLSDGVVVCRTLLRSSEGKGIVMASAESELVPAPLYTKYFKKKREFRVHVLNGTIIDVQEKRKKKNVIERDTRIRNLSNGYVFCRNNLEEPDGLRDLAIKATAALQYTAGAVDIAFNAKHSRLVVLEVNANPGLQGTTLENYTNAVAAWYKKVK